MGLKSRSQIQREYSLIVFTCSISSLIIGNCIGRERTVYSVCGNINFSDIRIVESSSFDYFRKLCRESILMELDRIEAEGRNKKRGEIYSSGQGN
jgi:hypothetical protein